MDPEEHSMQQRWEAAHESPQFRPKYPQEQVVRWTFRALACNATPKAKVLDLGCGAGRHSIFFATEGFDVYAMDISAVGLRELKSAAERHGVSVRTYHGSGHDLSVFCDDTFDAVLSFGVIYYMTFLQAEQTFREIFRVLRRGGKVLCVLRTDADSRRVGATPIGPCTWRIRGLEAGAPSDMEAGMENLFFSRTDVERLFAPFATVRIGRMTLTEDGFVNDDWLVSATKP